MTPGTSARLGNRSSDSHICRPTTTDLSFRFLPGLLANHEMAQRSIPALSKPATRKMPTKAALLKRTRAQRIPFRPGDRYSNKGRIHSRRPILSSSLFACKTAADHTFRVGGHTTGAHQDQIGILQFRFNEQRGKCVSSACLGRNAPERGRSTRACDRILFVQVVPLRP